MVQFQRCYESDHKHEENKEELLLNTAGGSIKIERAINLTDGVTEIKIVLNEELFPSIITVGEAAAKDSDGS